ncbi:MAG TPA: ASCH domain-containing protein [Planctomicrobium sp.]|nr:ASCH domain-containing protein [Planctomicrobium sp.]
MATSPTDHDEIDAGRIALSIQQPWAELIMQGIKTVEIRTIPTQIRGTVYLYAGKQFSVLPSAREAVSLYNLTKETLPRGCLVGTIDILDCRPSCVEDAPSACVPEELLNGTFSWILGNAVRCPQLWPVRYSPYGPWFYPFQRRGREVQAERNKWKS